MITNIIACFWIFIARISHDDPEDIDNHDYVHSWIEAGEFSDLTPSELYATSCYFTITTITTVGYGDISGKNTLERVICIFLHLIGVLSYSFTSGAMTSILDSYDKMNLKT